MERSLSAVLFLVASVALSICAGAWWMQRIVFTPDDTRDTAAAILAEPDIRQELNTVISGASAPTLGVQAADLGAMLENDVLTTRLGAAVMAPIIKDAHQRIIGLHDAPVQVTGSQMIEIVRDERAADVSTVTLPIQVIGTLKTLRSALGWLMPIAGGIGILVLLLGIFARPERNEVMRALGEFGLALALAMLLFGYAIPVHMITAIDNSTWTHAIPRLANRTLPVVLGAAAIFGLGGLALIMGASSGGGKRRQFSTPLAVGRYRSDGPGWG